MRLLAVDIGNTNVTMALLEDGHVRECRRMETDCPQEADYARTATALTSRWGPVDGAALCSVVPERTELLCRALRHTTGHEPLVVRWDTPAGLTLDIPQPELLGTDILTADAAAAEDYPLPVIVCDFGTATTVTVVDERRHYRGGAILAGIRLGLEALFSGTAQLPDIRLRAPDRVICGQTEESLLSGALYGAAAMTEGLARRMEQELGCPCTLVLTGGLGRFVAPLCRREAVYDEDLLLRGLWKLYTVNCPSADKP